MQARKIWRNAFILDGGGCVVRKMVLSLLVS